MANNNEIIPVQLDDGTIVKLEVVRLSSEEDVAFELVKFDDITKLVKKMVDGVVNPLRQISPQKIQVELGISIGIESGQLTALLTQGSGSANFKIALEWSDAVVSMPKSALKSDT